MTITSFAIVMGGAFALTGCTDLVSLNPLVADSAAATDENLEGIWAAGGDICIVRKLNGGVYRLVFTDDPGPDSAGKEKIIQYEGRLLRTNNAEILDLASTGTNPLHLRAHLWVRVWASATELRAAWLDTEWLQGHAESQLATQEVDGLKVITSTSDQMREFVEAYGGDDRAHNEPDVWSRLK